MKTLEQQLIDSTEPYMKEEAWYPRMLSLSKSIDQLTTIPTEEQLQKAIPGDDELSRAIRDYCLIAGITYPIFYHFHRSCFNNFPGISEDESPEIRWLMIKHIREKIDLIKEARRVETRQKARLQEENDRAIIDEIFQHLTDGLNDPTDIEGECRVSLLVFLNPVCIGNFSMKEFSNPRFDALTVGEWDIVLNQYGSQRLLSHTQEIIWTLEALQKSKRYPSAKYNCQAIENFFTNLNKQGGNASGSSSI